MNNKRRHNTLGNGKHDCHNYTFNRKFGRFQNVEQKEKEKENTRGIVKDTELGPGVQTSF